jgi:hypothetical protein
MEQQICVSHIVSPDTLKNLLVFITASMQIAESFRWVTSQFRAFTAHELIYVQQPSKY